MQLFQDNGDSPDPGPLRLVTSGAAPRGGALRCRQGRARPARARARRRGQAHGGLGRGHVEGAGAHQAAGARRRGRAGRQRARRRAHRRSPQRAAGLGRARRRLGPVRARQPAARPARRPRPRPRPAQTRPRRGARRYPSSRQLAVAPQAALDAVLPAGHKKAPKVYALACHPLQPHVLAVGANSGAAPASRRARRTVNIALRGYGPLSAAHRAPRRRGPAIVRRGRCAAAGGAAARARRGGRPGQPACARRAAAAGLSWLPVPAGCRVAALARRIPVRALTLTLTRWRRAAWRTRPGLAAALRPCAEWARAVGRGGARARPGGSSPPTSASSAALRPSTSPWVRARRRRMLGTWLRGCTARLALAVRAHRGCRRRQAAPCWRPALTGATPAWSGRTWASMRSTPRARRAPGRRSRGARARRSRGRPRRTPLRCSTCPRRAPGAPRARRDARAARAVTNVDAAEGRWAVPP